MVLPGLASGNNSGRARTVKEPANKHLPCCDIPRYRRPRIVEIDTIQQRTEAPVTRSFTISRVQILPTTTTSTSTPCEQPPDSRSPTFSQSRNPNDPDDPPPTAPHGNDNQASLHYSRLNVTQQTQQTKLQTRHPHTLLAPASNLEMAGTRNYDFLVRFLWHGVCRIATTQLTQYLSRSNSS